MVRVAAIGQVPRIDDRQHRLFLQALKENISQLKTGSITNQQLPPAILAQLTNLLSRVDALEAEHARDDAQQANDEDELAGDALTVTLTAAEPIGGHRAVYLASDGLRLASSDDVATADAVIGVTENGALAGNNVALRLFGLLQEPSWAWVIEQPIWLGLNGQLTQTPPTTGASLQIGIATTPTQINVRLMEPVLLAS